MMRVPKNHHVIVSNVNLIHVLDLVQPTLLLFLLLFLHNHLLEHRQLLHDHLFLIGWKYNSNTFIKYTKYIRSSSLRQTISQNNLAQSQQAQTINLNQRESDIERQRLELEREKTEFQLKCITETQRTTNIQLVLLQQQNALLLQQLQNKNSSQSNSNLLQTDLISGLLDPTLSEFPLSNQKQSNR